MIPWYVASLLANFCIMVVEYVNRETQGGWLDALPYTFVPIVVAQWGLFQAFNGAPHWLAAWAFFTVGNSFMRVAAVHTFAGGEVASWPGVGAGIAMMMAGAFIVKEYLQ